MNDLFENLRIDNLKENELNEIKDKINNTIEEIKIKSKTFEKSLLMNKTISFLEEDSQEVGHFIVNQRFDQFEMT